MKISPAIRMESQSLKIYISNLIPWAKGNAVE